jgi:putative hemolysin
LPRRILIAGLEWILGRFRLERIYRDIKRREPDPDRFFQEALQRANINVEWDGFPLDQVPAEGPLILVANHPFGIIDGLILCDTALHLRGDFRILLHALLCQDEDLDRFFLPVDFSGERSAIARNIMTKRSALEALRQNIPVAIFPGGGVATARTQFGFGPVQEFPWSTFVAKLVHASGATVLPIHFHGRNSRAFHIASILGEPLRLSLLIHEALNKFGSTIRVSVGQPVYPADLVAFDGRKDLTEHLLEQVRSLQSPSESSHPRRRSAGAFRK